MTFIQAIEARWREVDSLLCIGLDPDISKLPPRCRNAQHPLFEFNKFIIDATADLVCSFKPQIAYYSAVRAEADLELTINYIHRNYPTVPVILDAKRNDIGSTAEKYVQEVFDRYEADAVTINPYMGLDSLEPFLSRKEKGIIILCRSSNPGARDIQDLKSDGKKLYQIVARKAAKVWNYNGNVLLVVGATYPLELREIRASVGNMAFLVPGIGAQGGDLRSAVTNGTARNGAGMIISSSRAIIHADCGENFAAAARCMAIELRNEINRYR